MTRGRKIKKTSRKKVLKVKESVPAAPPEPQVQMVPIESIIKKLVNSHIEQTQQPQPSNQISNLTLTKPDINYLDALISEFLKCYIVIGYDLTGKKMIFSRAPSQQDRDGLVEHLRTTFLSLVGQPPIN